jgi:oligopeptide/dipeptide ABC transporter ATP-binding protein
MTVTHTLHSQDTSGDTRRQPTLEVHDLSVSLRSADTTLTLVEKFDLTTYPNERVAIVGESGSGKTVTAQALMRLNPYMRLAGSIRFEGVELLELSERQMRAYRGAKIATVFQDPLRSLNPVMTIGNQVAEPLRIRGVSKKEALRRSASLLDELGVPKAQERLGAYPHEFSGGMRQRVALAMALIADPTLLIADEPTTALDVRVQEKVLTLIDTVARERGLSVILITHDLGLVAGFADRVAVMYAGRKVEEQPVGALYSRPLHPYTAGLLKAVPRIDRDVTRLETVPGSPVSPAARPSGCAFHPRCPLRQPICMDTVPRLEISSIGEAQVACHLAELPEERNHANA